MSHHSKGFILAMTLLIIAVDFVIGQDSEKIPLLEPGKFTYQADFSLNPAIRPGPEGEWDEGYIESGDLVKIGDNYYWYYHGNKNTYQIGVAFEKVPSGPYASWEKSPFTNTVVVGYANGSNWYIPTKQAFCRPGGYETNVGTALFAPEAGEVVVEAVISMLLDVHNL